MSIRTKLSVLKLARFISVLDYLTFQCSHLQIVSVCSERVKDDINGRVYKLHEFKP